MESSEQDINKRCIQRKFSTMTDPISSGPLQGLKVHLSKLSRSNMMLKDKAASELREWKEKGKKAIKHLHLKVKQEVKQYELQSDPHRRHRHLKEEQAGWILSPQQMTFLREQPYLYNASAGSYLELMFLQRFWLWLAQFIPSFVAPSVITCLGLAINLVCCITVIYFSPDLKQEVPSWAFLVCALGVFLYQTLDALDGKQSFKVQNSPIEEIYDHMCDAVSNLFVVMAVGAAVQLGNMTPLLYALVILSLVAFYATHWTCHVTHTMVFGKIDVSEAQFSLMATHLVTAVYGQQVWSTEVINVAGYSINLCLLMVTVTIISVLRSIWFNADMCFGKMTPLEKLGIMIPRRNTVLAPLIPLSLLLTFTHVCYINSYFQVSSLLFMLTFGMCFAKLTMTLVMANISRGNMGALDSSLVVPALLAINSIIPMVSPFVALECGLVYVIMDAVRFFTYSSWDLREALDAFIFSIKYPKEDPRNRAGDNGFYINGLNNQKVTKEWKMFVQNTPNFMDHFTAH